MGKDGGGCGFPYPHYDLESDLDGVTTPDVFYIPVEGDATASFGEKDTPAVINQLTDRTMDKLDKLDHQQNLFDDVVNSILNQSSDIVTTFFIILPRAAGSVINGRLFWASIICFAVNGLTRLCLSLYMVLSGGKSFKVGKTKQLVGGLPLSIIEPISGHVLVSAALTTVQAKRRDGISRRRSMNRNKGFRGNRAQQRRVQNLSTESTMLSRDDVSALSEKERIAIMMKVKNAGQNGTAAALEAIANVKATAEKVKVHSKISHKMLNAQYSLDTKIAKLRNRQLVDLSMAILEDIPELIIDIIFVSSLEGDDSLTGADIALFVFTILVTLVHISKCIWTYVRYGRILGYTANISFADFIQDYTITASSQVGFKEPQTEGGIFKELKGIN